MFVEIPYNDQFVSILQSLEGPCDAVVCLKANPKLATARKLEMPGRISGIYNQQSLVTEANMAPNDMDGNKAFVEPSPSY